MRTCISWVLFLLALGGGVGGSAEPPLMEVDLNRAPGGGFGNLYLLGQQAVQQDLQLSDRQLRRIRNLLREVVEKQQAFSLEKDSGRRKQLADEAVQLRLRNDQRAVALLRPRQAERLQQLSLQYRGTASFWDPEVRRTLGISDEQFAKITALGRETYSAWNREAEAKFRKDRDFPAYQERLAENKRRRDREQVGVLTPKQQSQWRRMLGDPFQGPIPSPILIPALAQAPSTQPPAPSRRADRQPTETDRDDTVARLARAVESLAREVSELNQEIRRLREENDQLRKQLSRDRGGPRSDGRFRDRGDHIEDTQTGLLWQKDGDTSGKLNYYDAIKYAASLKLGGHSGWRVPTREELGSIFPAVEPPFTDTRYNSEPFGKGPGEWHAYWTSNLDTRQPDRAYVYQWYADGGVNGCIASKNLAYVRCVHDPIQR